MLYFDHNATSPLCAAARDAWLEASERYVGNPSSPHRLGARADAALDDARERLARLLGCEPHAIVWTSGATESANTVLHHSSGAGEGEAWVSAIEHPCVLAATRRHFAARARLVPARADGTVDLAWLAAELTRARPAIVAIMAANNETGVLQPWREALALCREHGVPFFCDAAQWVGKMPAAGLGACDFVSGCAHKFGGPAGVGFLKCPANLEPLIVGGPQEEGRRAGTENLPAVLALLAALEAREGSMREGRVESHSAIREDFEKALLRRLPGARVVGRDRPRLWNTVSVLMPELDCRQRWVVKLDKLGFAVSTGSACASGKEQPSHVLAAMGLSASEAGRALRFSSGWETRPADWGELLDASVRAFLEMSERESS